MNVDIYEICGNAVQRGISAIVIPQDSNPRNLMAFEGEDIEFKLCRKSVPLEQGERYIGFSSAEVIEAINTNGFYCMSGRCVSVDERLQSC